MGEGAGRPARVLRGSRRSIRSQTPSGKLEFYSQRLADHYPDDNERAPLPKWVESSAFHDERIGGERAKEYPLLLMSNHGRWRTHAQNDDISWQREIKTCKIKGWDGYLYEPIWINPKDAAARGIKDGDIVKLFNERGTVLGAAFVWERIIPGALSMDHGARADLINVGTDGFLDRGGANNLISPLNGISQNCWGMATSGFLVDVQKLTMAEMEEWREKYPEAFARAYDPAAGLRFDAWVIQEEGRPDEQGLRLRHGPVQRLLLLPDRLQGRALRQRLDAVCQTAAGYRAVLAPAARVRARHGAQGEDALRPHSLQPLRQRRPASQACKVEGAIYKREDGLVVIDPEKCTGCKSCVDVCPSNAIFMNENLNIAQKCTGCAHLLDSGEWTEPRCVDACPTMALKFMEEDEAQGADRQGRAPPSRRSRSRESIT